MKNTLGDLNNYLFAQIEEINDIDNETSTEEAERAFEKARTVSNLASQIIANGKLVLRAKELQILNEDEEKQLPRMLEG